MTKKLSRGTYWDQPANNKCNLFLTSSF